MRKPAFSNPTVFTSGKLAFWLASRFTSSLRTTHQVSHPPFLYWIMNWRLGFILLGNIRHLTDVCEGPTDFLRIVWISAVESNRINKLHAFRQPIRSLKMSYSIRCMTVDFPVGDTAEVSSHQHQGQRYVSRSRSYSIPENASKKYLWKVNVRLKLGLKDH